MNNAMKTLWNSAYWEAVDDLGLDEKDAVHYADNMVDAYIDDRYERAKERRLMGEDFDPVKI